MSRRTSGALAVAALFLTGWALVLSLTSAPAGAIPPGGADPDTPGTGASVSPRQLAPGGTLSYRVTGFPAGEVVYVKIDDGEFCSQSGVHGACVVAQQRIGSSGTASGSLELPRDLAVGAHWLRFLASEEVRGADGAYLGVKGYTARGGSDFRVVAASGGSDGPDDPGGAGATDPTSGGAGSTGSTGSTGTSGSTGTDPTTGADPADPSGTAPGSADPAPGGTIPTGDAAPAPGDLLTVAPPSGAGAVPPVGAPTESTAPAVLTPVPPAPQAAAAPAEERFPVVGAAGAAVLVALAGAVLLRGRRSPRG